MLICPSLSLFYTSLLQSSQLIFLGLIEPEVFMHILF